MAVDTTSGPDSQPGHVAALVRPGWSKSGVLVRPAEVVVWSR